VGDGFQLQVQPQYVYTFDFMSTNDVVKLCSRSELQQQNFFPYVLAILEDKEQA